MYRRKAGELVADGDNWLDRLCTLAEKWRAVGFTHLVVRQTDKGCQCCVFPAAGQCLREEERFGCILMIPLDNTAGPDFPDSVSALRGLTDEMWIFDGRAFVRPWDLH